MSLLDSITVNPEDEETRNFVEILKNYEKLLKTTQDELKEYKEEQDKIKNDLTKIIRENEICNQRKLQKSSSIDEDNFNKLHEKYTNVAIENLKSQILQLQKEKETIHSLWKTSQIVINNLEKEVNSYRNQLCQSNPVAELENKYSNTIQLLENTIKSLRHELIKQSNVNKEILKNKQEIQDQFHKTENLYKKLVTEHEKLINNCKKLDTTNINLKRKFDYIMQKNNDLVKSLEIAKIENTKIFTHEQEALLKLEEAIIVAEIAIEEKEKAIDKEKLIRSECDELATTIGQVMEDAAQRVDKNFENLKNQYEEQIKKIQQSCKDTKELLEKQTKLKHTAETRIKILENKLNDALQANNALDADLQIASQTIIEMELKVETLEQLLDHNKNAHSTNSEELQEIVQNCKQFKEKWTLSIEDLIKNFEQEASDLQNENINLKLENEKLRLQNLE